MAYSTTKSSIKKYLIYLLIISLFPLACKKDQAPADQVINIDTSTIEISGQDYPVVKIEGQLWTSMNYKGPGGMDFFQGDQTGKYGKHYTEEELRGLKLPSGWTLPALDDYRTLAAHVGIQFNTETNNSAAIRKLTSKTGWLHIQGTNSTGFNAYPAGYFVPGAPPVGGDNAEFIAADHKSFSLMESADRQNMIARLFYNASPSDRFTVRFVKKL